MFSALKKLTGYYGVWTSEQTVMNAVMREVQGSRGAQWWNRLIQPWFIKEGFFGENHVTSGEAEASLVLEEVGGEGMF